MRRLSALTAVVALIVAACTASSPTTTVRAATAPAPPTAQTTPRPTDPGTELVSCDEEVPTDFTLLCEVYQLIRDEYVNPVSDQELVDAAVTALTEASLPPDTEDEPITCALPSPGFLPLCDAIDAVADVPDAVETAVQGMVSGALDPFSAYLDPATLTLEREEQSGTVQGIGALVITEDRSDPERPPCGVMSDTCRLVIVSTLEGSPAEAAGLQSGDEIVGVEGEPIDGWSFEEVTSRVRGPAGTPVTLTILREGSTFDVTIVRAAIELPVVDSQVVDGTIGYLRLRVFTDNSDELVHDALEMLLQTGIELVVLDLRGDPGGALDAAVNVTSEFLAEGLVLRTISPDGEIPYEVRGDGVATDIPLIIVVDRGSASASEVVSGALQEAGRAVVVGEPTFGKNTVQRRFGLSNGGALKLTIARWETPGGHDFGGVGIIPDVAAEFPGDLDAADVARRAVEVARDAGLIR